MDARCPLLCFSFFFSSCCHVIFCVRSRSWGTQSWTGAWSANSPLWTPALRRALNYPAGASSPSPRSAAAAAAAPSIRADSNCGGTFWITFEDFLQYFRTIDVCKFQDEWHVVRLQDRFPLRAVAAAPLHTFHSHAVPAAALQMPAASVPAHHVGWSSDFMYELTVTTTTCCFISLIQADLRGTDAPLPHTYKNLGSVRALRRWEWHGQAFSLASSASCIIGSRAWFVVAGVFFSQCVSVEISRCARRGVSSVLVPALSGGVPRHAEDGSATREQHHTRAAAEHRSLNSQLSSQIGAPHSCRAHTILCVCVCVCFDFFLFSFSACSVSVTCEVHLMSSVGRYLILPCSFAATIGNAAQTSALSAPAASLYTSSAGSAASAAASASTAGDSFPFVLCIYSAHPVLVKRRPAFVPALTLAIQLATIVADTKKLSEVRHPYLSLPRAPDPCMCCAQRRLFLDALLT